MIEIQASAIGVDALVIFKTGGDGEVIGQTSRGLFCAIRSQAILFLSLEEWRGPLTINLHGSPGGLNKLADHLLNVSVGSLVQLDPHGLRLLGAQDSFYVRVEGLAGWRTEKPLFEKAQLPQARKRTETIASLVRAMQGEIGWSTLLPEIAAISPKSPLSTPELQGVALTIRQFRQAWSYGSIKEAADVIGHLLGCGGGLTPSGDDLVIGLLLGLFWLEAGFSADRISLFSEQLINTARERTTTLGACLIASAARGQVDERLASGMAGILTGNPVEIESATRITSYGNSSGMDALVGFYLSMML